MTKVISNALFNVMKGKQEKMPRKIGNECNECLIYCRSVVDKFNSVPNTKKFITIYIYTSLLFVNYIFERRTNLHTSL